MLVQSMPLEQTLLPLMLKNFSVISLNRMNVSVVLSALTILLAQLAH